MRKKNRAKWIGSGIFTGICLWFTQVNSMELGGFDVEVGTGEDQEYPSDWWDEPEVYPEQETEENRGGQENQGETLIGDGETEEDMPPQKLPSDQEGISDIVDIVIEEEAFSSAPEQEVSQEGQQEGQMETVPDEQACVPSPSKAISAGGALTPTQTPIPAVFPASPLTPDLTSASTRFFVKEASGPVPLFRDFSVSFSHPSVPENQRKPYVEIQSEGQIGIVSVRHNHQECFWWWEGKRLFWEMEPVEGENKIEILAVTEDCRLIQMKPWIYKGKL